MVGLGGGEGGSGEGLTTKNQKCSLATNYDMSQKHKRHQEVTKVVVEVLLYVHRNRRFIRDGSPGQPPRLSHSS